MSAPHRLVSHATEQRGAVIVTVALFMPVALLFFAYVVDAGYSWLHKRHLQVQADAAALAAAQQFQPCSDPNIGAEAQQYGGMGSASYNQQIGRTTAANIHQLINSQTFYGQSSPVDTTVNTADPCSAMMVDVKMTETNLPWWMAGFHGILSGVPFINAQARVEIHQEQTLGPGSLPTSVNDPVYKAAEAYFINESTGTVLGAVALTQQTSSGGLSIWSSAGNPYSLTVPSGSNSDVGVRIALSATNNLTGNMSTDCSAAWVNCYDTSGSTAQLLDVHGWSSAGTGTLTAPVVRQALLTPGTCGDQYYTSSSATCTDGIQASIDFGPAPSFSGIKVQAVAGGGQYTLTCTTAQPSVCTGSINVSAGTGRNQVGITVSESKNTLTFSNVQSTYAAAVNGNAGPIQTLGLSENGVGDVSSLQQGSTHSLVVNLGVTGSLQVAQSVNDPLYVMRFNGTGSQNQSVSCTAVNGGSTFADMLASGCAGSYQINKTLTCPDSNTPIDCLSVATGNKENQVAKGINTRVLGSATPSTCTSPNHWSSYPDIALTDPRVVTVFITPYGSFSGSGAATQFPIENFAAFYITGWADNGGGFKNPCQGNGDDTAQPGTVVGHFIKYINLLNTSGAGSTMCDPSSLGECIAVLTR